MVVELMLGAVKAVALIVVLLGEWGEPLVLLVTLSTMRLWPDTTALGGFPDEISPDDNDAPLWGGAPSGPADTRGDCGADRSLGTTTPRPLRFNARPTGPDTPTGVGSRPIGVRQPRPGGLATVT